MTDEDPVPLLPPRLADAPFSLSLYSGRTINRFASFVHPSGGRSISTAGVVTTAEVGPVAAMSPFTSLASWLLTQERGTTNPHMLREYIFRLDTWETANPAPSARPPRGAPVESPNLIAPLQLNRQERQNRQLIYRQGTEQQAVPVNIPSTSQFAAKKNSGIWYVTFRDELLAAAPTKRRARALARFGNEFLTRLQSEAVVNPNAILDNFGAYFDDATNPASGFQPTMNITWPS
jgi:hypothetical protein